MPDVLNAFVAFVAEHKRCGELNGGKDNGRVWIECSCGGPIVQPAEEPPRHSAAIRPA